jgi:catechol 2,3-dioxygenase-like lactoylglutathione lyase family enzyme
MSDNGIVFDHIHIISEDPEKAAKWYAEILGGRITGEYEIRGSVQFSVAFDGANILIRGQRPGEEPGPKNSLATFNDYVSHDQWGTDHFGFRITANLDEYCDRLRSKGATFSVEPNDFAPGVRIAYLSAPDNVSIELVHVQR